MVGVASSTAPTNAIGYALDGLDHVRRQDRTIGDLIDDVRRDVRDASALVGVFEERARRVVAAIEQPEQLGLALVELVVAERADHVAERVQLVIVGAGIICQHV